MEGNGRTPALKTVITDRAYRIIRAQRPEVSDLGAVATAAPGPVACATALKSS